MARAVALVAVLLVGLIPGSADAEVKTRLFPQYEDETGVLLLAQVAIVVTRQEIVDSGDLYTLLLMTGIPDTQLGDGRLVSLHINCCGAPVEESAAIWAFVPPDTSVGVGDVVEVRMGRIPNDRDLGTANAIVGVRQLGDMSADSPCRWQPDDPGLKTRTLHCRNIESEGWVQRQGYLRDMWHRPPAPAFLGTTAPLLILVSPSLRDPIRDAVGVSMPRLTFGFEGDPAVDGYVHVLKLHFDSAVDQSRQRSNREGASMMGLLGWMVGSVTPWPCPTTHTLTGVITDRAGTALRTHAVQKEQKRVGTMLVCGKVEKPSDAIIKELMADFLQTLEDEKILVEPVAMDSAPGESDHSPASPTHELSHSAGQPDPAKRHLGMQALV